MFRACSVRTVGKPLQIRAISDGTNLNALSSNHLMNNSNRMKRMKTDSKGPQNPNKPPQQQGQARPQQSQGQTQRPQQPQQPQQFQGQGQSRPQQSQGQGQGPATQRNVPAAQPRPSATQVAPAAKQELIVNVARDPVRVVSELGQLIAQEVNTLEAEETDPFISEYLKIAKFEVAPRKPDEDFRMTKVMDKFKIEVTFSTQPPEAAEEEDEDMDLDQLKGLEEDEEEEGPARSRGRKNFMDEEDEKEDQDEEEGEAPWMRSIPIQVKVSFLDASQNTKGVWNIQCVAGEEERLFVDELRVEDPNGTVVSSAIFDGLSQPVQDKIYDLLDELSVDDNLSKFVQHALMNEMRKDEVNFLKSFNKLIA